ncbi:rho GTPase-activating protein 6 isoform X2 [Nematostella vectensis]|uniref:rho GTPase-activating protein 6 isoform X2 n=1 Tax=Nematostella vectensis TaxID=45351 RepID=UPI00139059B3|nr:rho GTPase-activating protein 6 isoform X2 [Nematostella vectensis]
MVMESVYTGSKRYKGSKRQRGIPRNQTFTEGMQRKGSQKDRFFTKPWRNRPKVIPNAGNSLWSPDANEDCTWCSVGGRKVLLTPIKVGKLSEPERLALQQVALLKLRKHILRSHVTIPKASRPYKRSSSLKRALSLKSRLALGSDKEKDSAVFAIPLRKAVAKATPDTSNGIVKKSKQGSSSSSGSSGSDSKDSSQEALTRVRRHSASSINQNFNRGFSESADSKRSNGISEQPGSPSWKSRLIDALTLLSSSASASCIIDKQSYLSPASPQVPTIVNQAIEHLENYGLHVLGIFRTGGSKKRMKQMREQFDSGEKTQFNAEDNPHDVAALFKEYLRDLPEPLLTRELYSAFLETQGISDTAKEIEALQLLCCLLPAANRDTLNALLAFLSKVDFYAEDKIDDMGCDIPGNKMNSKNLATLIGPNILHKVKSGSNGYSVDDIARAEETKKVIEVTKDLIDYSKELFMISAEIHHEVFLYLLDNEPEVLDFLLRKKNPIRTSADEEEMYDFECRPRPRKPSNELTVKTHERARACSEGNTERTAFSGFIRAASLNSRPPPEYPHRRRGNNIYSPTAAGTTTASPSAIGVVHSSAMHSGVTHPSVTHSGVTPTGSTTIGVIPTATWERSVTSNGPVPPVRSSSRNVNPEECCNAYKQRLYARQLSNPEDSTYSRRQRTPPTPSRGPRRFGNGQSEPPSPALSHSFSRSLYSTPLSSPPSTPFYSAESASSTSNSSPAVSYLGSEGPILSELTQLLSEVEKDLARERERERLKSSGVNDMGFDPSDWQLEKWLHWETQSQHNSSRKDALEQETLV